MQARLSFVKRSSQWPRLHRYVQWNSTPIYILLPCIISSPVLHGPVYNVIPSSFLSPSPVHITFPNLHSINCVNSIPCVCSITCVSSITYVFHHPRMFHYPCEFHQRICFITINPSSLLYIQLHTSYNSMNQYQCLYSIRLLPVFLLLYFYDSYYSFHHFVTLMILIIIIIIFINIIPRSYFSRRYGVWKEIWSPFFLFHLAIDLCKSEHNGCGPNSVCESTGPGTRVCRCFEVGPVHKTRAINIAKEREKRIERSEDR